jgi:adenine-specific DNA-methyltransferase
VTLWDKPPLSKQITGHGDKSAIRTDWRTERRSAYNYRDEAASAYRKLLATVNAHYVLTSYSTDGMIPLQDMLQANAERGHVHIETKGYKRYRVSSQRFSHKPMNVEVIIVLDTHKDKQNHVDELLTQILSAEKYVLQNHRETSDERQLMLFGSR